jgi:hypothetical protein
VTTGGRQSRLVGIGPSTSDGLWHVPSCHMLVACDAAKCAPRQADAAAQQRKPCRAHWWCCRAPGLLQGACRQAAPSCGAGRARAARCTHHNQASPRAAWFIAEPPAGQKAAPKSCPHARSQPRSSSQIATTHTCSEVAHVTSRRCCCKPNEPDGGGHDVLGVAVEQLAGRRGQTAGRVLSTHT